MGWLAKRSGCNTALSTPGVCMFSLEAPPVGFVLLALLCLCLMLALLFCRGFLWSVQQPFGSMCSPSGVASYFKHTF